MPEQALFCSSRLLSQQARGCSPREPVFFHQAFGGGGQGERSGSHPAALSEDVRATAWKPVSSGRRENSIEIGLCREGFCSRGSPSLVRLTHRKSASTSPKNGFAKKGLRVRHPQRRSRTPQGACQARRAGNKALRRGRLKCARRNRRKPYR